MCIALHVGEQAKFILESEVPCYFRAQSLPLSYARASPVV